MSSQPDANSSVMSGMGVEPASKAPLKTIALEIILVLLVAFLAIGVPVFVASKYDYAVEDSWLHLYYLLLSMTSLSGWLIYSALGLCFGFSTITPKGKWQSAPAPQSRRINGAVLLPIYVVSVGLVAIALPTWAEQTHQMTAVMKVLEAIYPAVGFPYICFVLFLLFRQWRRKCLVKI